MPPVRPKKHLGQHFLNDRSIAEKIVGSLSCNGYKHVLEIGAGMGVLTGLLLENKAIETHVIEIDPESVSFLNEHFPGLGNRLTAGDFLKTDLGEMFHEPFAIIGNFPYNISSQILFRILEHREMIPQVVGMFQKEVAQRVASPPGNKTYGILSVLLQAFYEIEYLFTVDEGAFNPPPAVKSAVIRLSRNNTKQLDCDEKIFIRVVKTGFNQRRKTLRNALKPMINAAETGDHSMFRQRAEELSVGQFVELTNLLDPSKK